MAIWEFRGNNEWEWMLGDQVIANVFGEFDMFGQPTFYGIARNGGYTLDVSGCSLGDVQVAIEKWFSLFSEDERVPSQTTCEEGECK